MEKFKNAVEDLIGIQLTDEETILLYSKYKYRGSSEFDLKRFENDLKKGVVSLDESGKFSKNLPSNYKATIPAIPNKLHSIYEKIRESILHRGNAMPGNDDNRKAFLLLSNCRSPTLSKEELKTGCLYRLSLPITDEHISIIFNHIDKNKTGQISVKELVDEVMKEKMQYEAQFGNTIDLSRSLKTGSHANASNQYGPLPSEEAFMKFDKSFHNLEEPSPHYIINKMTLLQLEENIRDKVIDGSRPNTNALQALSRAFGDNRERDSKFKISLQQMKYTIWKKLMIYATKSLIETLFKKYDPHNTGYVDLNKFADGVIAKTIKYKPLVEETSNKFAMKVKNGDAQTRFGQVYNPLLVSFLEHMRSKIKQYINNTSCSPAYLSNATNRMNSAQAKKFLEDNFKVVVGENVMKEIINEYDDNGLLDMRRLLKDAMIVDMNGKLGPDVNLITSSAINVDEMPSSIRSRKQSYESIQRLFSEKIQERLKNSQPLSYLHLMFRSKENDADPRVISKQGLRKVLYKQDITLSDADYDEYFGHVHAKHGRGDGKVVIRDYLIELLPASSKNDDNSFLPKNNVNFKAQDMLSKSLALLTGHKREVMSINGEELNRFRGSIIEQVEDTMSNSKRLDATNDVTTSEFFKSINSSLDFHQKRSESPRAESPRVESSRAESPSIHRTRSQSPAGAPSNFHDPKYSIITHQKKDDIKEDNNNHSKNNNKGNNYNNNHNNNSNNYDNHDNNRNNNKDNNYDIYKNKNNSNNYNSNYVEEIAFQIGRSAAIAASQSKDNKDIASQIGVTAAEYALNILMNENNGASQPHQQNLSRPSSAQQNISRPKVRPQSAPVKNEFFMNGSLRMNKIEDQHSAMRSGNPPSQWQLSQNSFDTMTSPSIPRPPSSSKPSNHRTLERPSRQPSRPSSATSAASPSNFSASPSNFSRSPSNSSRSPREKIFTYTGVRRSGDLDIHKPALQNRYRLVNKNVKQSSNDYGSYFKIVQNEKKKNEKIMQDYRDYLQKQQEDNGNINPKHSQASISTKVSGRYSNSNMRQGSQTPRGESPSLNQRLANYGPVEHNEWKKYNGRSGSVKSGEAATFNAYQVLQPGKVTQINKKFALQFHKNSKKK